MPRPPDRPAPFDVGTFTVRGALEGKVPPSSLRTLENPFRGVRGHVPPETPVELISALGLVRPGFAASHCTAARLHGLPIPRTAEHESLHIMTGGSGRVRRPGVIAHRGLDRRRVTEVAGVAVTGLAQTWVDLAPFVGLDDLVVLGDAVAQRLGGVEPLRTVTSRRVPGVRRAREALEWIRVGSASPMETRSRVLFVRVGLPEPELNVDIHDDEGGWLATSDLVWREARVAGEYQGADHFADYGRGDKDIVRRRGVEEAGWTHVDFTKDDYYRTPRRIALVQRVARELGCALDPIGMWEISNSPGLPGWPLRTCGG